MKKLLITITIFTLCCVGIFAFFGSNMYLALCLPDDMYITHEDVAYANEKDIYSKFVQVELEKCLSASQEEISDTKLYVKILGITAKTINVKLVNETEVFVGGNTVGFNLTSKGVVIVGSNKVMTSEGEVSPFEHSGLKDGDCITKIDGKEISDIKQIDSALNDRTDPSEKVQVQVIRNEKELSFEVKPVKDIFTKKYKLGIWVRNNASGVGTLTYVKQNNNRFGAVGHPIIDNTLGENFTVEGGDVYQCNLVGIKKATKNSPGEIRGSIDLDGKSIGIADTNCKFGVYGTIYDLEKLCTEHNISIGGRMSIKPGKAQIFLALDGKDTEPFDIKIIKANSQKKANEKSIVFKVTDKKLIEKTGGIVQGMSGSPIVQNGKLVGAVTHVYLNDPTKGYGVYIDWMIDN